MRHADSGATGSPQAVGSPVGAGSGGTGASAGRRASTGAVPSRTMGAMGLVLPTMLANANGRPAGSRLAPLRLSTIPDKRPQRRAGGRKKGRSHSVSTTDPASRYAVHGASPAIELSKMPPRGAKGAEKASPGVFSSLSRAARRRSSSRISPMDAASPSRAAYLPSSPSLSQEADEGTSLIVGTKKRERRRSSIVVSEQSAEAAKKLANKWGTVKSIKAKVTGVEPKPFFILSPGSRFMRRWDTLTLLCLIIVAVLTPYELAFLEVSIGSPLFVLNRVIDGVFIIDIFLTFFLEYRDGDTMLWIYSYRMIARRYLRSWFIIDFVSVLPFDLTSTMLSTDGVKSLQIVRVLRVAKLAKLARVMRLARIHARWERDMDVPFATLALGKFAAYMLTMTHWFACLWGLLGSFQTAEDEAVLGFTTVETSWLQAFDFQDKPAFDRYVISVHWAMQTVSTIGYGDIRAVTTLERLISCVCMAFGASVWTYVVASVCGIVTSLDPHGTHRKHTIAEVNEFMMSKRLPDRWRPRLRSFFISRENYHRTLASRRLLRLMSPTLRGEVARHLNKVWIHRVPYLRHISAPFLTELAMSLQQEFYAPEESIQSDCLHILEKGVCLQDSRVIPMGFVWGEDMILDNPLLRNTKVVYTLAHTQLHKLDRASFFHILSFFPEDKGIIIAAANWITVRRKLLMWMAAIREKGEDVATGLNARIQANHQLRQSEKQIGSKLSIFALGIAKRHARRIAGSDGVSRKLLTAFGLDPARRFSPGPGSPGQGSPGSSTGNSPGAGAGAGAGAGGGYGFSAGAGGPRMSARSSGGADAGGDAAPAAAGDGVPAAGGASGAAVITARRSSLRKKAVAQRARLMSLDD